MDTPDTVQPLVPDSKPSVVVTIEADSEHEVEKLRELLDDLTKLGHKILHISTSRHWLHG